MTTTKLYKIAKYRVVLRRQNTDSRPFLEKRSERSVEIICSRDKNGIQKHQNSPLSQLTTEVNRRSKKSSENGEGFTLSLKICDLKTSNLAMLAASATQETGRWPPRKHSTKNIIVDNGHSILIQRSNPHGQVYDLIRTDR